MLRLSSYIEQVFSGEEVALRKPTAPVVIWNLTRRCNLTCKHCYSVSTNSAFPGELSLEEIFKVMADLKQFGVKVLVLSGGEPLMRDDIFEISNKAKEMGFYVALSTNGTLLNEENIEQIAQANYDYLGISIDGLEDAHDAFRQQKGAYQKSMAAIKLCVETGIKVGVRNTPTLDNKHQLPELFDLMTDIGVHKFYLSHLNYGGRGFKSRGEDVIHTTNREIVEYLINKAIDNHKKGIKQEIVTGNNDADGVFLLLWMRKNHPEYADKLEKILNNWGGNSSGVNIANIDYLGKVHPDTFWWDYELGNVKDRPFSEIWQDTSDKFLAGLKSSPRPLKGRCATCKYQKICNGNTRVRAYQLTKDFWAEDPGCYLTDEEI